MNDLAAIRLLCEDVVDVDAAVARVAARLNTRIQQRENPMNESVANPQLVPYITVRGGAEAIDFYKEAFGATEMSRLVDPSGSVMHAQVAIGDQVLMLADENPSAGNVSPASVGNTTVRLNLHVEDVDALATRAMAAGAELVIPIDDQFYGHRSGRLRDPYGHEWIISSTIEDMSPDEMQRRANAMFE